MDPPIIKALSATDKEEKMMTVFFDPAMNLQQIVVMKGGHRLERMSVHVVKRFGPISDP
jgi:hypothetical protein